MWATRCFLRCRKDSSALLFWFVLCCRETYQLFGCCIWIGFYCVTFFFYLAAGYTHFSVERDLWGGRRRGEMGKGRGSRIHRDIPLSTRGRTLYGLRAKGLVVCCIIFPPVLSFLFARLVDAVVLCIVVVSSLGPSEATATQGRSVPQGSTDTTATCCPQVRGKNDVPLQKGRGRRNKRISVFFALAVLFSSLFPPSAETQRKKEEKKRQNTPTRKKPCSPHQNGRDWKGLTCPKTPLANTCKDAAGKGAGDGKRK